MSTISVIKGISGSGKSSRVFQFLSFLKDFGFTLETYKYNGKSVGVLAKEINLLFIGKIYSTNGIERWQGYDAVTGAFGKASIFSEFLAERNGYNHVIVEGAGITQTHRLRPRFILQELEYDKVFMQYYNYPIDRMDVYLERIIYRSGKPPHKDVMWQKNDGMISDLRFSLIDFKELSNTFPNKIVISDGIYTDPINDFGIKYLKFLQLEDLIDEFKDFVVNFDYINKNKYENFKCAE